MPPAPRGEPTRRRRARPFRSFRGTTRPISRSPSSAAFERFWREAISRARAAGALRTIRLDEVTSSGDLGYALGVVVVRIPGGPELTTKYATIWQRDPDGRWRLAVNSSSPNL
ncbi:MAG TPA: hypothetical protein VGL33_25595 [Streptosporangiaceae bacterium]